MKRERKVPRRRFRGFRNDREWEQRKLEDIVSVYDGIHQTPEYQDSGIMFLSVENISTLKSEKYISEEAFRRDYKVYPEKGDILMTRIGDVGTPNVIETSERLAFYVSLALLKPSGVDSYFLCNSMLSPLFQKGLRNRTLVTAIPQKINKDEIGRVNVILPTNIAEQEKIGSYFKKFNNLITLNQCKLEKLKALKKAYLTQMFPSGGECKPKLRFAGFNDEWDKCIVGELGNIITGTTPSTEDKSNYGQDYLFVSPVDINNNRYIENTITKLSSKGFKLGRSVNTGSTLFVSIGSTIGKVAQVRQRVVTNQQINAIESSEKYDANFVYSLMVYKAQSIRKLAATQAVPIINKTTFSQIEVYVSPNINEQQKIGEFFVELDNIIDLHQRKLQKLQNLKKAYLNEMFI